MKNVMECATNVRTCYAAVFRGKKFLLKTAFFFATVLQLPVGNGMRKAESVLSSPSAIDSRALFPRRGESFSSANPLAEQDHRRRNDEH